MGSSSGSGWSIVLENDLEKQYIVEEAKKEKLHGNSSLGDLRNITVSMYAVNGKKGSEGQWLMSILDHIVSKNKNN